MHPCTPGRPRWNQKVRVAVMAPWLPRAPTHWLLCVLFGCVCACGGVEDGGMGEVVFSEVVLGARVCPVSWYASCVLGSGGGLLEGMAPSSASLKTLAVLVWMGRGPCGQGSSRGMSTTPGSQ